MLKADLLRRDLRKEEERRKLGDAGNWVSLDDDAVHNDDSIWEFPAGKQSLMKVDNLASGYPAYGVLHVDRRHPDDNLAYRYLYADNGDVYYQRNVLGGWSGWKEQVTSQGGAIIDQLHFDNCPTFESPTDLNDSESAVNIETLRKLVSSPTQLQRYELGNSVEIYKTSVSTGTPEDSTAQYGVINLKAGLNSDTGSVVRRISPHIVNDCYYLLKSGHTYDLTLNVSISRKQTGGSGVEGTRCGIYFGGYEPSQTIGQSLSRTGYLFDNPTSLDDIGIGFEKFFEDGTSSKPRVRLFYANGGGSAIVDAIFVDTASNDPTIPRTTYTLTYEKSTGLISLYSYNNAQQAILLGTLVHPEKTLPLFHTALDCYARNLGGGGSELTTWLVQNVSVSTNKL